MCDDVFLKIKGSLKVLSVATLSQFEAELDKLRATLHVPVAEIDVTDLFASIARYVFVEGQPGVFKPEYAPYEDSLVDMQTLCNALSAKGDGQSDDTCAIRAAIAMVPRAGYVASAVTGSQRPVGGAIIRFPTADPCYVVTERIDIPWHKGTAMVGDAPFGATIRLDGLPQSHVFAVRSGEPVDGVADGDFAGDGLGWNTSIARSFERLNLVGGGVVLDPYLKLWTSFRDCVFRNTTTWALDTRKALNADSDIVNVEIQRCTFSGCAGGVRAAYPQLVGWSIDQCRFEANTDVDVYAQVGEVHITNSDFVGRPGDKRDRPYVQVETPGQAMTITNCRLGAEPQPPRDLIVLGPLPPVGVSVSAGTDVHIEGCVFGGPATAPTDDDMSAHSIVRIRLGMVGLRIRSCTVWSFHRLVCEEAYETAVQVASTAWQGKVSATGWPELFKHYALTGLVGQSLVANILIRGTLGTVFTRGGRGFEVVGESLMRRLGRGMPYTRHGGNRLRDTESMVPNFEGSKAWDSPLNLTVTWAADPTSPNGTASWKLTRKVGKLFAARISQTLDAQTAKAMFTGGPAVLSVWLRADAGKAAMARLSVVVDPHDTLAEPKAILLAVSPMLRLTERWQRFTLLVERMPVRGTTTLGAPTFDDHEVNPIALDTYLRPVVRIDHGAKEDQTEASAQESVIWVAQPQFELGDTATPYAPSSDTDEPHAERPEQALMLGSAVVGYGDGPPTMGRYLRGDLVLNTAPTIGGDNAWRGWVCTSPTTGQAPAKWVPFGRIK